MRCLILQGPQGHGEQTRADQQRRITESFSKAAEQLGSDKLEVRLGGVYSLERISKESLDDYWTVMENLTAFVRERSRRNEADRTSQDFEQRISKRAYFLWLPETCDANRSMNARGAHAVDWLVIGQVVPINPAAAVREPKLVLEVTLQLNMFPDGH